MKTCARCGSARGAFLGSAFCETCDIEMIRLGLDVSELQGGPWADVFVRRIREGGDIASAARAIEIPAEMARFRVSCLPWLAQQVREAEAYRDEVEAKRKADARRDYERKARAKRRRLINDKTDDRYYRPL